MTQASRDQNRVPTLIGVSSVDGVTPALLYVDPTSHELLVNASLDTSDIEIGAVELKDHDGSDRAAVNSSNELQVRDDDANTDLDTLAGAVSGSEMQVDVVTMPTTTVTATDLDIRDLTSTSDSVEVVQGTAADLKATVTQAGNVDIGDISAGTQTNDVKVTLDSEVVSTTENAPTTVVNGQKTVTSAGTAEALGSTTTIESVTIKALEANDGNVYVGDSSVDSTNGLVLTAGEAVSMDIDNLDVVYIDVDTNGEGVSYLGVN